MKIKKYKYKDLERGVIYTFPLKHGNKESYVHIITPTMHVEAGWYGYSDGSLLNDIEIMKLKKAIREALFNE